MSTATEYLPLTDTIAPADQADLAGAVAGAHADETAIYPLGGGTSLQFGLVARRPGIGLALGQLNRVVDYPARDMTITVEAGLTMAELARTLDFERQWLPIEVPSPEQATVGGVVATAWCGPRRFGWGTVRDYVIGISAVDGRGMPFKGGGRVVKNVAGYDFCKLLTGSLGTIGVITQVTFKIKPQPARSALLACPLPDWQTAEQLLARLVGSAVTPAAVELVAGPVWDDLHSAGRPAVAQLLVGLDGSAAEVDWMTRELQGEWRALGMADSQTFGDQAAEALWDRLREFSAGDAALALKASLRPSATVEFVKLLREFDPQASIQAHAGTGIVIGRFAEFAPAEVSRTLIGRWHPAAVASGGHAVVLSSAAAGDLTRQAVWGGVDAATPWMTKVKQQFDPRGLLNPGRFIYGRE